MVNGNTADYRGGGVDGLNIASFTMKGSATVTPSTGEDANKPDKNDVYLAINGKITIVGELKPKGRVLVEGASAEVANFTVTPNSSELWEIGNNGFLKKQ